MEFPVGGDEQRLGPVSFLQTPSGGPVISIPQDRIDLHRLVKWVPHAQILAVLEHLDWYLIYQKSAPQKKKSHQTILNQKRSIVKLHTTFAFGSGSIINNGLKNGGLHNLVHVPKHSVGMVILGGVESEVYSMFSLTLPACKYIGLKNVGFLRLVPQEFKVYLIVFCSLRRNLPAPKEI